MAISLERVSLTNIVKSSPTQVVDMSGIKEAANGKVDSLSGLDAIKSVVSGPDTGMVNAVKDKITTNIDGLRDKTQSLLDKVKPDSLSLPSSSIGIFGNILCGKIPSPNITLPSLNLNFLRDLDFDFDVVICGESKKMNPLDAALSVKKELTNIKGFITTVKETKFKDLVNDRLNVFSKTLGLPKDINDCLFGDMIGDSYGNNGPYGDSLRDRITLMDLLNRDNCKNKFAGNFLSPLEQNDSLNKLAALGLLDKFVKYDNNGKYTNAYVTNSLRTNARYSTLTASRDVLYRGDSYNRTPNKLQTLNAVYLNPYYNVATGTIRPVPLATVNGMEVYDVSDDGTIVYGYGQGNRKIVSFTTTGQPVYEADENNNPVIGYTSKGKPIYGYDRTTGLPIIEITPSGDGVLESGLVTRDFSKFTIANNRQEMSNTPTIGYLENNRPFYGYTEDGFPITSIGYTTTGDLVYGVDEFNNPIIGYTDSGKPIFGYDRSTNLPIVKITSNGTGILESGRQSTGFNKPTKANNLNEIVGYPGIELPKLSVDFDNNPITPYGSSYLNNDAITAKDLPYLQLDSEVLANSMGKMDVSDLYRTNTSTEVMNNLLASLTITDKGWNVDSNNNEAYYTLKNDVIKDLSSNSMGSNNKSFLLTGNYVTNLTKEEKVGIVNLF